MQKEDQILPNFVVFDIETTGLDNQRDKIIEIGAVKYLDNGFAESFDQLIDPERHLPYEIVKLTGITMDDVRGKPTIDQIAPKFSDFIADLPVVAHNAPFDVGFLKANGVLFEDNEIIDTLTLAHILLPQLGNHKLKTLIKYFQIKIGKAHRAYDDAVATSSLLFKLLDLTKELTTHQVGYILELTKNTEWGMDELLKDIGWQVMHTAGSKKNLSSKLQKVYRFRPNIIGDIPLERSDIEFRKPIDEEAIGKVFYENGPLSQKYQNYEKRTQQIEMARSVARAFNDSNYLMAEAGTGTGKSFAYLVPSIYWAMANHDRVIISTKTKNLQDQLFQKDIPLIRNILQEDFTAALLKGRENYLCKRKWEAILNSPSSRLDNEERLKVLPLVLWADYTKTGDIAENNGFNVNYNYSLWKKVNCDRQTCFRTDCKYFDSCFMRRVRMAAINAHLVVINHYLFYSDLSSGNKILGKYSAMVFDEAHNIEDVATDFLGAKITVWDMRKPIHGLFRHGAVDNGLTISLRTEIKRSKLEDATRNAMEKLNEQLIDDCKECERNTNAFFQKATEYFNQLPKDPYYPQKKLRYKKDHRFLEFIKENTEDLHQNILSLIVKIEQLVSWIGDFKKDEFPMVTNFLDDFEVYHSEFEGLLEGLEFLTTANNEEFVFWAESPRREDSYDTRLFSAPLSIANLMHNLFYEHMDTVILTSATLTVGKKFGFFKSRLGLGLVPDERFASESFGSPFKFQNQAMVCVPSYMASPKMGTKFNEEITDFIKKISAYAKRGALALFTSYYQLNHVYQNVKSDLEADGILVLGQGKDGSNQQILEEFKEVHESLLLGTDSFWEGVDVPGDSLQILFVTKLPFASPGEPIVQARTEAIEREGGNSFMEYSVPLAVIQFRQGFGRLIRSRNDKGVVFVLDNRVVTTRYGRIFLDSLPLRYIDFRNPKALGRKFKEWLLSH